MCSTKTQILFVQTRPSRHSTISLGFNIAFGDMRRQTIPLGTTAAGETTDRVFIIAGHLNMIARQPYVAAGPCQHWWIEN